MICSTNFPFPLRKEGIGLSFIIPLTAFDAFSYESKGSAVGLMGVIILGALSGFRFLAVLGSDRESQIPLASLSDGQMLEESVGSFDEDAMGCLQTSTLSLPKEAMETVEGVVGLVGRCAISNPNLEVRLKQRSCGISSMFANEAK